MSDFEDTKVSLQVSLQNTLDAITTPTITLRRLFDLVGEHGLLFLCALLTIPFLLPVSIPGVSAVFGLGIILISIGITLNRMPWLPRRLMDRELDSEKLTGILRRGAGIVARIERFIKPRLKGLTSRGLAARINGLALIFGGLLLILPLGLIPFSNTLPAYAILFLAIGMIQRDGLVVILGHLMNVAACIYLGVLAWLALQAGQGLAGVFGS